MPAAQPCVGVAKHSAVSFDDALGNTSSSVCSILPRVLLSARVRRQPEVSKDLQYDVAERFRVLFHRLSIAAPLPSIVHSLPCLSLSSQATALRFRFAVRRKWMGSFTHTVNEHKYAHMYLCAHISVSLHVRITRSLLTSKVTPIFLD